MSTPTTDTEVTLDPWEPGISDEEMRRRQGIRNQSLIALLQEWQSEAQNATEEERRQAEAEWEEFARGIDENRPPGHKLFS